MFYGSKRLTLACSEVGEAMARATKARMASFMLVCGFKRRLTAVHTGVGWKGRRAPYTTPLTSCLAGM